MAPGSSLLQAAALKVSLTGSPEPLGTALTAPGDSHEELVWASWTPRALALLLLWVADLSGIFPTLLPRNSPIRRFSTKMANGSHRARGSAWAPLRFQAHHIPGPTRGHSKRGPQAPW